VSVVQGYYVGQEGGWVFLRVGRLVLTCACCKLSEGGVCSGGCWYAGCMVRIVYVLLCVVVVLIYAWVRQIHFQILGDGHRIATQRLEAALLHIH
jgi:hypothetical protein